MGVNNSVADAKKIEYLGPYTAQQIGVNRYLAELDMVNENTHEVQITSVNPNVIESYIDQNEIKSDKGIQVEINGDFFNCSIIKEPLYDPTGKKMRS